MSEPRAAPLQTPTGYAFPTDDERLLPWSHAEKLLETARNGILRLTPTRARGWSTSALEDGTGWEFEE